MKWWTWRIAILLLLAILPQILDNYYVNLMTKMLIFAIFAMSLDLVIGYMGLPSLGHAAFFGVAAYTIGIFSIKVLPIFWLNLVLSIAMAGFVAAVYGLLALRTREAYFFMITLALAEVLWAIAFSWRSFTKGDDGIPGISRPDLSFIHWPLTNVNNYFYFVLLFFVVASILLYIIVNSPFGHVILGIRESELRMRALGYNAWLYKYILFIVAGLFAGLAGTLSVYFNGFVSPSDLGIDVSAEGLLMVLLGGPGTLFGPALGAGIIVFMKNVISTYTTRWVLVLGVIYVLVVMFAPKGVLGLMSRMKSKKKI